MGLAVELGGLTSHNGDECGETGDSVTTTRVFVNVPHANNRPTDRSMGPTGCSSLALRASGQPAQQQQHQVMMMKGKQNQSTLIKASQGSGVGLFCFRALLLDRSRDRWIAPAGGLDPSEIGLREPQDIYTHIRARTVGRVEHMAINEFKAPAPRYAPKHMRFASI